MLDANILSLWAKAKLFFVKFSVLINIYIVIYKIIGGNKYA